MLSGKRLPEKMQAEKGDLEKRSSSSSQAPAAKSVESLLRSIAVCRAVAIEITNKTKDVMLQDFRSYCFSGVTHVPPPIEVLPGSTEQCAFAKTQYSLRGSVGVLLCKMDSCFLAIMFSIPFDYVLYKAEFALEIFTTDNHLGSIRKIYQRMMRNRGSNSALFQRSTAGDPEHQTLEVSKGKIRVRASMSNNSKAVMKVQIEEKNPPPYS